MTKPSERLRFVRGEIESALCDLAGLFDPRVKLTFIARAPYLDDSNGDVIVTNDDLAEVEMAVRRLRDRPAPASEVPHG